MKGDRVYFPRTLEQPYHGPIFFGLVYPVGTDAGRLISSLSESVARYGYQCKHIHIIDVLIDQIREIKSESPGLLGKLLQRADVPKWLSKFEVADAGDQYGLKMDLGNLLRKELGLPVFAYFSASLMYAERESRERKQGRSADQRVAYIIQSLKVPEEVETLRWVYGDAFFLISAYSDQKRREDRLIRAIGSKEKVKKLMERSEEEDDTCGQKVVRTFHLGDVFFDVDKKRLLKDSTRRFLDLLFGRPDLTPKPDEYGMFVAQAAALRSGSLARQVGASITTDDGEIVAVGCNEVPKSGGGEYWCTDPNPQREVDRREDVSDKKKAELKEKVLGEICEALRLKLESVMSDGMFAKVKKKVLEVIDWVEEEMPKNGIPKSIDELTEFGRTTHAEMSGLLFAARRGVSVRGCVLYTTLFPCHNCARHMISAGIKRVVFIEPYSKSLAFELHSDSLVLGKQDGKKMKKVKVEPFVGVSPRLYQRVFTWMKGKRKKKDGKMIDWEVAKASLRIDLVRGSYKKREMSLIGRLEELSMKGTRTTS